MTGPRLTKKMHDYDRNPKRFLWSFTYDKLKIHFPDNYEELIAMKKAYHKEYYARNKQTFNVKRKFNRVLKELRSKF